MLTGTQIIRIYYQKWYTTFTFYVTGPQKPTLWWPGSKITYGCTALFMHLLLNRYVRFEALHGGNRYRLGLR